MIARRMVAALVALAGLLASLVLGTPTAAAPRPAAHVVTPHLGGVFTPIKSLSNNLCLQPSSNSIFASVVQEPCAATGPDSIGQGWEFLKVATNHYQFLNQLTGLCLDAFDGAVNGGRVLVNTCANISNDQWNTGIGLPNTAKIESRTGFRDTGWCIDTTVSFPQPGLPVLLFGCNDGLDQGWLIA